MEIELKVLLEEYKKYTIGLLECLEKEDYDSLELLMNKRQLILDDISNEKYYKEQFSEIFSELELTQYEQKLDNLMIANRDKVKNNIKTLSKSKSANNVYNKSVTGAMVFSKKI